MKHRYAHLLLAAFGLLTAQHAWAQPPCNTNFTTPAGQTPVANTAWAVPSVPPNMSGNVNTTTTLGSTTATVTSAINLAVGNPVTGPNIPPGTTITNIVGTTITLSNPATATATNVPHTYTIAPYALNYPPTSSGVPAQSSCSICPATYSVPICAGQYVNMYLCAGNLYTFSMCSSAAAWNSTISVTTTTGLAPNYPPNWDDDGCGAVNGHAVVTFTPQTSNIYRIRVFNDPCVVNGALCGTLQVACNPFPPPPPNDNPTGAIALPGGTTCSSIFTSAAYGTPTTGVSLPNNCSTGCTAGSGSYATSDVWYTAVVPASGNLAVQLEHVSATNMAMAVYTAPGPGGPFTQVTCGCNADSSPGILNPFLSLSSLPPGATVYIRVWPEGGFANNGTFEICAYEPVPPPNDNPCGAVALPVGASCTPQTFTTQNATALSGPTVSPATPTCGTPVAGGDVWFTVTVPATGSLTVSASPGVLTDMAMAAYTLAGACGSGTLTQVDCNDNFGASLMPRLTLSGAPGQVYYIRMWNKTSLFGTFQICAFQNNPPPNDNPCSPTGASVLPVQPGCLYGPFQTTDFASNTPTSIAGQHVSIAAPSCGGATNSDVWYTAVVPSNGVLQLDTDDGGLTDLALAIYTATGNCAAGTLALTQVPGACFVGGSANGANMPAGQATGLTPGSTVYIRAWRQSGNDGTFQICARTTVPPPGNCTYTLRMFDSAGDGWNGSFVTVCVGAACTNYSINGANGTITIGANFGQIITVSYTAAGGFQNQISYQLLSNTGGLIYGSTNPPTPGLNTNFVVDALCNVPPAPPSDCVGSLPVCDTQVINQNPSNTGGVADLSPANRGCLVSNERQGVWFRFQAQLAGQLAFTINPAAANDYDFAIWGPFSGAVSCPPPTPPLRCSYAAGGGPTGLNYTSIDLTEGAGGDRFVRFIDVLPGQWFLLYVDNFAMSGVSFTLNWSNTPSNILDCTIVLPVELLSLNARAAEDHVAVTWSTASEQDASHFVVERSGDGNVFEPIGQVAAAGTTLLTTNYRFDDQRPLNGTNYYRLRTVDIDGKTGHTQVVTAEFRRGSIPLQLFPNPANETISASFVLGDEGAVRWRILDMSGRLVQESNVAGVAGNNRVEIPLGRVDAGSYLFEVVDANGVLLGNMRFVKQ